MFFQSFEIIFTLTLRNLKIRYEKSLLGFLWTVINPLATFVIYYFVFARIVKIRMEDYWVFLLSGLLIWQFISSSINSSTGCIQSNKSIIKKMVINHEFFVISLVLSRLFEFFLESIVAITLFSIFGRSYSLVNFISIVLVLLFSFLFVLSISLFVSALSVYVPDFSYGTQIGLKLLFFMCPIFYGKHSVPAKYMKVYNLNPLNPFIENYRDILYKGKVISLNDFTIMFFISIVSLLISYLIFKKLKVYFAEII